MRSVTMLHVDNVLIYKTNQCVFVTLNLVLGLILKAIFGLSLLIWSAASFFSIYLHI